jgi:hypothetical protein
MATVVLRYTTTRKDLNQLFDDPANPYIAYWAGLNHEQLKSGELLEKNWEYSPDNLTRTVIYRFPDMDTFARLTMARVLDPQIKSKTLLDVPFVFNSFGGVNIDIRLED